MMEYAGIEAARIEAMEERLKKDVLAEVQGGGAVGRVGESDQGRVREDPHPLFPLPPQALKFGGRILVAHESFEPGHNGELYDTWEEIDHPDAVQTTAEVWVV